MHQQRLINQNWFLHFAFAIAVSACIAVGGVLHFDKLAASDWRSVFNDLLPTFSLMLVVIFWVYCGVKRYAGDREEQLSLQLKLSERQFTTLSSHLPAAVYVLDRNLKFTQVLGEEFNKLKFNPKHLLGMNLHDFLRVAEDHRIVDKHRAVLAGASVREEIKWKGRTYLSVLNPLIDEARLYKGVMGFVFDITEQKKIEQQLRDAEARWASIVENVPGVIFQFICDGESEGRFSYVSPNSKTIIGVEADVLLSQTAIARVHEDDSARVEQHIAQAAQSKSQSVVEGRLIDDDGNIRWWRSQATPVPGSHSAETIFNGIFIDLTEIKRVQHELQIAREVAERASRAKSDFLSTVSHEIRTPMNGVIGMSSLLLDSELNSIQRQRVETIQSCGHSLLSLINDVLDFSRIESGKIELEQISFCPRNLLEDCIQSMASAAQEKGLDIASICSANLPEFVLGDATRLRQVVLNLLSNAVKFTAQGEVILKAEARTHGDWSILKISIADTGIGLTAEQKSKLFSPFSIGASALNAKRAGGSGLGLALSHKIISAMGGKVSATSEEGKGSEFTLELPCKVAEAGKGKVALQLLSEELPSTHVFILQRTQLAACAIREACEGWGLSTETITDEKQLLAKLIVFSEPKPSIVVIDSVSCDFDELNVVKRIRSLPEACAQVPIILITPLAVRGATEQASEAGCSAFLTKPIRQEVLFNAISGVLKLDSAEITQRIITRHSLSEAQPDVRPCILLVEDNPINQKVAVAMLAKLGCRVEVAENGEAALVAMNQRSYDLVFMDLQMPVMDGLDATERIRNSEKNHNRKPIPIVALTANAFPEDKERCFAVGMNDFIAKPVNVAALSAAMDKWLKAGSSGHIRIA